MALVPPGPGLNPPDGGGVGVDERVGSRRVHLSEKCMTDVFYDCRPFCTLPRSTPQ